METKKEQSELENNQKRDVKEIVEEAGHGQHKGNKDSNVPMGSSG